jgi:carbon-monoxide dehydrogenase large subunit
MEADVADVEFENGTFKVAGTDKSVPLAQVVFAAYVPHNYPHADTEPGMDENAFYDPANFVYPSGTQICEVEIDPDTGVVEVIAHTAVDDFGNIINPMIVEGQVHGGIVQGVGQALYENAVYDKGTGQLLSGSYMDYTMPRADNVPSFKLGYKTTPCPHNPLGVKGCGEAGAIAAPAAVMNAVRDALAPLGIKHVEMPATSLNVWQTIQGAHHVAAE